MQYTNLMLLGFGILGMLLYILRKVKKINDASVGNFNFGHFLKLEWPSILSSLIVIIICIIAKTEVARLEAVSEYLGLGFVFIGYGGQSWIYSYLGKAEKKLNITEEDNTPKP